MAPSLFGVTPLLLVAWTLSFELLWYFVVSTGGVRPRVVPLLAVLCFALAVAMPTFRAPLFIGVMLTGAAWTDLRIPRLHARLVGLACLAALTLTVTAPPIWENGQAQPLSLLLSRWLGVGLFVVGPLVTWPRIVCWLGTISYSLYLGHALVLVALPGAGAAVWLVGSLLVAVIGYYGIERPFLTYSLHHKHRAVARHLQVERRA